MRQIHGNRLPTDLEEVAERLKEERPEASALELDRIKTRAMRTAAAGASVPAKGASVRPRLLSILIVVGVLVMGTGGVMAATGGVPGSAQTSGSAAVAEYPQSQVQGTSTTGKAGKEPSSQVEGTATTGSAAAAPGSGNGSSLAFTGLDVAVLLGVALALIAGGFAIQRFLVRQRP